jgi:hypothetical protein
VVPTLHRNPEIDEEISTILPTVPVGPNPFLKRQQSPHFSKTQEMRSFEASIIYKLRNADVAQHKCPKGWQIENKLRDPSKWSDLDLAGYVDIHILAHPFHALNRPKQGHILSHRYFRTKHVSNASLDSGVALRSARVKQTLRIEQRNKTSRSG